MNKKKEKEFEFTTLNYARSELELEKVRTSLYRLSEDVATMAQNEYQEKKIYLKFESTYYEIQEIFRSYYKSIKK